MVPSPELTAVAVPPDRARFADEVRRDLARTPKQLHPKYLYDDLGSALFDAICHLPWYPVTRAEKALILQRRHAMVAAAGPRARLVELGCGTGEKLQLVVEAFVEARRPLAVDLVDISAAALDRSARAVGSLPGVSLRRHHAAYEEGLAAAAAGRAAGEHWLVLLLGSNLGNFDPDAALAFLRGIRGALAPRDLLLLGVDLVKPRADLLAAYDDPLGVTAAFNRNLLVRLNRELQAEFDLDAFQHRAIWNEEERRVEMHLVSGRPQVVRIPGAGCLVRFDRGETIWTESSYKYEPEEMAAMAALAGFVDRDVWVDPIGRFALALLDAS